MNEPHDPNQLPSTEGPTERATPDERSRAERRRQLLRIGTAVPMVLTLRPGSTLAASAECTSDSDDGQTTCAPSLDIDPLGRDDVSERPTLLAGRTASSYAKYWLDRV